MSQVGQYDYLITPFATITGNTGDVVLPINNNVNIIGGKHLDFNGNAATATLTLTLDGELADTYTTDDGDAVPANFIIQILGGANINTAGAANIVRINLDPDITMPNNGTIRTNTTAGDKYLLQAYDVDGTTYKAFATLTANNTPTMDLDTDVTIGTKYIYRVDGTDVSVPDGGTGASTHTQNGVLYGNGANAIGATAEGATGTVLVGTTSAAPSYSANPTLTSVLALTFDTNVAAAGVTLSGTTLSADGTDTNIDINITAKGTGKVVMNALSLGTTDHGLLVGSGAAAIDALAEGTTGQVLQGVTSNDPTWSTTTYPSTVAKGDVLVASADNVIGVVNDVVNAGYVLTANVGAAPSFQAPAGGAGIETLVGDDSNTASGDTVLIVGGKNINTSGDDAANMTINLDDNITVTSVKTDVAAANLTLSGNTITSDGTDTDVDINLVAKGLGGLTFDGIATGWSDSQWNIRQRQVQTTDATETVLVSIALTEGEMLTVTSTINGFQNDFTDALGGTCVITAYRPTGGNVTQIGEELLNINCTSTATLTAGVDTGTQTLRISVIGVAAETWNWVSCHQYMFTKTNA